MPLRSLLRMSFGAQVVFVEVNLCSVALYAVKSEGALDLHALDTPPAFILSQDQTLNKFLSRLLLLTRFLKTRKIFEEINLQILLFWISAC